MIAVFHDELRDDAHEFFQAWRRKHDGGYFINCTGKKQWMVHRVPCAHPGDTEWGREFGKSLTRFKKVCSEDFQQLLDWARLNSPGTSLVACSHCSPPSIPAANEDRHDRQAILSA